jgi:ATP:ADP antiporter, AAA family
MTSDEDRSVVNNINVNLPTEDEIEKEAKSGTGIYTILKIAKAEKRMFWTMTAMFGLISFIYSVARVFKDAAVIGKQHPTSIFFLKFFVILPCSIISVGFIQKALEKYPFTRIFDFLLGFFALAFIVLGGVLLPFSSYIQIQPFWARDLFADGKFVVRSADYLFAVALVLNEWTSSLIYVISEMFGSLILSYMFNTFANSLTTPDQSTRFVPLFYVFSNLALLISGLSLLSFNKYKKNIPLETAEVYFNIFFCLSGILCMAIYGLKYHLEKNITCRPIFIRKDTIKKKSKVKVGFVDGLVEMSKSKLLLNISLIVLFYSISTNIIESSYKSALSAGAEEFGQNKGTYSSIFNSIEQIGVSIVVIILLISPFPSLIQTKGWIYIAILCPILTLISTFGTFVLAYINYPVTNKDDNIIFPSLRSSADNSYIVFENWIGVVCVALMKISKYAAFDITKESISMQIDGSIRAKYKGIFDGVFGKLGKSFGSIYGMCILALFNCRDIRKAAPISFSLLIVFCVIWFYSVFYLNSKYSEAIKNNRHIDIDLFDTSETKADKVEVSVASKTVKTDA